MFCFFHYFLSDLLKSRRIIHRQNEANRKMSQSHFSLVVGSEENTPNVLPTLIKLLGILCLLILLMYYNSVASNKGNAYITVTSGMSAFFAKCMNLTLNQSG